MARKNNSRRMPNRPFVAPAIGDPSPVRPEPLSDKELLLSLLEDETQLDNMDDTQLFNIALRLGIKATDLLEIRKCYEHMDMIPMYGQSLSKLNWATDVRWCKNCFGYFRFKVAQKAD